MRQALIRSWTLRLMALAVALVGVGWVSVAAAGSCGGGVPCKCGDTVTSSTTLTADLGPCPGVGLKVKPGVVLDCGDHAITGNDQPGAKYGVLLDAAANAEVRSCRITAFRRGIRLYGGHGNSVTDNEIWGNRYGIDLAGGSTGNTLAGNYVYLNRDEGIHVGTGAHDTVIRENRVRKNKKENIYILSSDRCRVIANTVSQTNSAAIFVKHSHDAYVAKNTVVNGPIQVRGDSFDNVFEENHLRGNGYFFEAYQESDGTWTYPHDNRVTSGVVENTKACLRFAGAYDNVVDQLMLDRKCKPPAMWAVGGQEPTGNVIHTLPLP